jgi:hypothetical protein
MAASDTGAWKAILGDDDNEVIKAGTLAVTRGTGVVAAAVVAVANIDLIPGGDLTAPQKLWASVAIIGIWAILASADALARAKVTAAERIASPQTHVLTPPLDASLPEKSGADERGWKAMMLRTYPAEPDKLEYWVVKGDVAEWCDAEKVRIL